jgi:hypothetical protein
VNWRRVQVQPKTPNVDTLVGDIYELLRKVEAGQTVEISEEALGHLSRAISIKIKNMLTARTSSRKDKTLHMSEAGRPCVRQLWYAVRPETPKEPLNPNAKVKFLFGDILEELLLFLSEQSGHSVTDQQKECEILLPNGWKVRGRMDATIDGMTVDVKSASTYAFRNMATGSLEHHDPFGYKRQISCYKACNPETSEDVGFFMVDKQNGTLWFHKTKPESHETLMLELERITNLLDSTSPPPRIVGAEQLDGTSGNLALSVGCGYCAYKHECFKDANGGAGLRKFLYAGNRVTWLTKVVKVPRVIELTDKEDTDGKSDTH